MRHAPVRQHPHPSGRQFEIRLQEQSVTAVEVGGGLRTYTAGGAEVLDGYPARRSCGGGRGQLLLPWPNRIQDGTYWFGGADHRLPLTEPERGNAIHGLTRWSNWSAADHTPTGVTMRLRLFPQPGYPFTLDLETGYALDEAGLTVRMAATNLGDEPCPFGAGAHPYLTRGRVAHRRLQRAHPGRRHADRRRSRYPDRARPGGANALGLLRAAGDRRSPAGHGVHRARCGRRMGSPVSSLHPRRPAAR